MSAFRIDLHVAVAAVVALGLAAAAPRWAAAQTARVDCKLWGQLEEAVKALDVKAAAAAERAIRTEPDCINRAVEARKAMLDLYRAQDARMERQKTSPALRLAQLQAALKYRNDRWNVSDIHAKIADLLRKLPDAKGQLDHAKISLAYDRAVVEIDRAPASQRPKQAEIARIARLAYQFEALSETPLTREGGYTRAARQVTVGYVPAPLQFEYDKTELTLAGKAQAQIVLKRLQDRKMPEVHLVGHTDPVGSYEYNDDLSLRRAAAIKKFLVDNGYPSSKITIAGRGKRDLLKIEEREAFTEAQVHQMLRRVELKMTLDD